VALVASSQVATAAPKDKIEVLDGARPDDAVEPRAEAGPIEGSTKLRTRARPGHAHTLWYVIFNSPENCSDAACGDDDILIDPSDHSARVQRAADRHDPHVGGLGKRRSGGQPGRTPEAGRSPGRR